MRNDQTCDHPAVARIIWEDEEICDECGIVTGPAFYTDDMIAQADSLLGIQPRHGRIVA